MLFHSREQWEIASYKNRLSVKIYRISNIGINTRNVSVGEERYIRKSTEVMLVYNSKAKISQES